MGDGAVKVESVRLPIGEAINVGQAIAATLSKSTALRARSLKDRGMAPLRGSGNVVPVKKPDKIAGVPGGVL